MRLAHTFVRRPSTIELAIEDVEWDERFEASFRSAAEEEFAEERPTAELTKRTSPALRAALVRPPSLPPLTRLPKATQQRDAVVVRPCDDDDATDPEMIAPPILDLCRG